MPYRWHYYLGYDSPVVANRNTGMLSVTGVTVIRKSLYND